MDQEKKEQKEKEKKEHELRKKFKVSFLFGNVNKGLQEALFSIVRFKIYISSSYEAVMVGSSNTGTDSE